MKVSDVDTLTTKVSTFHNTRFLSTNNHKNLLIKIKNKMRNKFINVKKTCIFRKY